MSEQQREGVAFHLLRYRIKAHQGREQRHEIDGERDEQRVVTARKQFLAP